VQFDELEKQEQLALAGLVRLVVRMDGQFSPGEVDAVAALAREVGATDFWSKMAQAQTIEMDELGDLVEQVRPEIREWMYGVLVGLAAVDGVEEAESDLLSWLMDTWDMNDDEDGPKPGL
jgi:hypothetical protein